MPPQTGTDHGSSAPQGSVPADDVAGRAARRGASESLTLGRAHVAVVALVTVAALAGTVLVLVSAQPRQQAVPLASHVGATPSVSPMPSSIADATASPASPAATLTVHVVGQVHGAGVVRVPAGSRVVDALEAAGGPMADADLTTVNLARPVRDGEQIRVGLPPDPRTGSDPGTGAGPLDVNSASAAELEELPGVGPVLAARIVSYRDENGLFRTVDQLIEVPGIGPAVLASLDGLVRV